jgi:DNA-binding NarL/FixJ family response regulator
MYPSFPIKVIIADDHEVVREGLKASFKSHPEILLVGEARNGEELLTLTRQLKPNVILTDIKMPKVTGVEATQKISKKYPDIGIVALTTFNDDHFILDMKEAGAKGFVLKDAPNKEIVAAIHAVYANCTYFCSATKLKMERMAEQNVPAQGLNNITFSIREKEIIRLLCKEFSSTEISEKLFLSKRTVDGHRERIMRKINAQNIVGLVTYAIRNGLVEA